VDPDYEPDLFGRLEDRPVLRIAVAGAGTRGKKHLHDVGVSAGSADLGCHAVGILGRDDDRALQARIQRQPVLREPVLVRARQRRGELGAWHGGGCQDVLAGEDGVVDPVGVEELLAQEVVGGTGWASLLGEGVAAPESSGCVQWYSGRPMPA
jgi:hypothetical protein